MVRAIEAEPFSVVEWGTDKVLSRHAHFNDATKTARALGHNGFKSGKWFEPVACVTNVLGECVYNPKFIAD